MVICFHHGHARPKELGKDKDAVLVCHRPLTSSRFEGEQGVLGSAHYYTSFARACVVLVLACILDLWLLGLVVALILRRKGNSRREDLNWSEDGRLDFSGIEVGRACSLGLWMLSMFDDKSITTFTVSIWAGQ
jgi:hypothetical protein